MFLCVHHDGAAMLAARFSPWWELTSPDTAIFDAARVERLLGSPEQIARAVWEQSGRQANVALAAIPDAALLAAHNFAGVTIIRNAAGELAELGLESLPIEPDLLDTFGSWGVRTLGDLAALPENGLASRIGERALSLQRLARGAIQKPLQIHKPPEIYAERIALDHPIELLEPLLFLLARILNDQCDRLTAHGLATNEIRVTLSLDDRSEYERILHLPVPMRDGRALLKLLQMDLEAHPPQAAMTAVDVALSPVEPRRFQHGLFIPQAPAPDKLELTLARIRGLVGEHAGVAGHASPRTFPAVWGTCGASRVCLQAEGRPCIGFSLFPSFTPCQGGIARRPAGAPHRTWHLWPYRHRRGTVAHLRRMVDADAVESRRMGCGAERWRTVSHLQGARRPLARGRRV
jgi:hypothetical protein